MCKFCEALESWKSGAAFNKTYYPDCEWRYSVALVIRTFVKGRRGSHGRSTDYRYRGCGYKLNFCPECGRKISKKSVIDDLAGRP